MYCAHDRDRFECLNQVLTAACETSIGLDADDLSRELLSICLRAEALATAYGRWPGATPTTSITTQAPGEAGDLIRLLARATTNAEEIAPELIPALARVQALAQARWEAAKTSASVS